MGNNLTTFSRRPEWCYHIFCTVHTYFWPHLFQLEEHTYIDVLKANFECWGFDAHALMVLLVLSSVVAAERPRILLHIEDVPRFVISGKLYGTALLRAQNRVLLLRNYFLSIRILTAREVWAFHIE